MKWVTFFVSVCALALAADAEIRLLKLEHNALVREISSTLTREEDVKKLNNSLIYLNTQVKNLNQWSKDLSRRNEEVSKLIGKYLESLDKKSDPVCEIYSFNSKPMWYTAYNAHGGHLE